MRKLIFAALLLPILAKGQVYFEGDSIVVETPANIEATDHQINIQNADALHESVYFWSFEGVGKFPAQWCNVRISRTYIDPLGQSVPEWAIELKKVQVTATVSAMPNKRVLVQVTGGNFDLQIRHFALGGWYSYMKGGMQFYPAGTHSEGTHQFYIPYQMGGTQIAVFRVHAGVCSQRISKLF